MALDTDMTDKSSVPSSAKFSDPAVTLDGSKRAHVAMDRLETLWVNTGTLCNVECAHCYIESSPKNDRLTYLTRDELKPYLEEAKAMGASEIGFTGGEPFLNPHMSDMLSDTLEAGFTTLVLTNAMRPMQRPKIVERLLALKAKYQGQLSFRVSIDHYTEELHDKERGPRSFEGALKGLKFLSDNQFSFSIAGRFLSEEGEASLRDGYARLFEDENLALRAHDPASLVIFPEMDEDADVPEVTDACWDILNVKPGDVMCASSRMLIKRKGASSPMVMACTLIAYDERFEMGQTLAEASQAVTLNHPHCAKFCVLGGASCTG